MRAVGVFRKSDLYISCAQSFLLPYENSLCQCLYLWISSTHLQNCYIQIIKFNEVFKVPFYLCCCVSFWNQDWVNITCFLKFLVSKKSCYGRVLLLNSNVKSDVNNSSEKISLMLYICYQHHFYNLGSSVKVVPHKGSIQ